MYTLLLILFTIPAVLVGPGFAMPIEVQTCDMCVTSDARAVSFFERPWRDEQAIGLLAHNYLAGQEFDDIERGDYLVLIYPGRRVVRYRVVEIRRYYGRGLDEWAIYEDIYRPGALTLQTCIGNQRGFLFIIAELMQ